MDTGDTIKDDIRDADAGQLRHARAGVVQHGKQDAVALTELRADIGRIEQGLHFVPAEVSEQRLVETLGWDDQDLLRVV